MVTGASGSRWAGLCRSTAIVSGLALPYAAPAFCQTVSDAAPVVWTGAAGSSFSDGQNWSTTPLTPGAGDSVEINSGTANIISNASVGQLSVAGGSLRIAADLTTDDGTSLSSGWIAVLSDATMASDLTVTGGVFSNSGTLDGDLFLLAGSAVNDGTITGETTVENASLANNGTLQGLSVQAGGIVTNNSAGSVSGSTDLAGGTLTNNGRLAAVTVSTASIFTNNSGATAGVLTNAGTSSNAGTLAGLNNGGGSFTNNAGGVVSGLASISGGTVSNNATFADVFVGAGGIFTNNTGATAGDVTNAGTSANSGTIAMLTNTAGTFTNNADGSVTGATTVSGGAVTNNGSMAEVSVGQAANVVNNSSGVIGAVSNSGQFANAGTVASLINLDGSFSNSGTISGSATVSGGTLVNDGSVLGALDVTGSGTLTGTGRVASLTIDSGGTLSPGLGFATLDVAGDLVLQAGATYSAEISASGAADLVDVGGAALLGGTLEIVRTDAVYDPSISYTLISAEGGISGQFDGVTADFAYLSPELTYAASSVTMDLDRNTVAFSALAGTANARAAADAADRLPASDPLYLAVLSLSQADASVAFEQLDGDIHASLKSQLLEDSQRTRDVLRQRMATDVQDGQGFWTSAFGARQRQDGNGNAEETSGRIAGLMVGLDAAPFDSGRFDNARLGAFLGASRSKITETQSGDRADIQSYHAGVYGGTALGPLRVSGGALWSNNQMETDRSVNVGSLSQILSSDYDGNTAQVFAEISTDVRLDALTLSPFASIAHVRMDTDGFAEEGGSAALSGARSLDNVTLSTFGLRFAADLPMEDVPVALTGELGWRHAFGDLSPETRLSYAGGESFTVNGTSLPRDAALVKAGLEAHLSPSTRLTFHWSGLFSKDEISNSANLALALSF
jgi:subtilase-type serine protease